MMMIMMMIMMMKRKRTTKRTKVETRLTAIRARQQQGAVEEDQRQRQCDKHVTASQKIRKKML